MQARIDKVAIGTRPELAELEATLLSKRGRITPLYEYLFNSPKLAAGWEAHTRAVRQENSLPGALRELIILRVAVLNRAPYEFEAHAPIALKEGLSAEKIIAVKDSTIVSCFDAMENIALRLTDAMTRDIEVDDALFAEVEKHFQPRELLDLCITIATYNMVSRLLVALRIGH